MNGENPIHIGFDIFWRLNGKAEALPYLKTCPAFEPRLASLGVTCGFLQLLTRFPAGLGEAKWDCGTARFPVEP